MMIIISVSLAYGVFITGKNLWKRFSTSCYRCNIILISVDNLREDRLPCYGYSLPTAPNLCAFAGESTLFTRAYSNASWTLPTDMTVFTGLYPSQHDVGVSLRDVLNPAVLTLPEIFRSNGYHTVYVSNVQQNVSPVSGFGRGFNSITYKDTENNALDYWVSMLETIRNENKYGKPVFAFLHSDEVHDFKDYAIENPASLDPKRFVRRPPSVTGFSIDIVETAIEHIESEILNEKGGTATQEQYIGWLKRLKESPYLAESEQIYGELPQYDKKIIESRVFLSGFPHGSPERIDYESLLYDAAIQKFDRDFGTFLTKLSSLHNKTIVLFYSEHGEFFGEHGLTGHGTTLYEEEIHIPMILHVPGAPPKQETGLIQHKDIFPTLLDYTGIAIPAYATGIRMRRLLEGDVNSPINEFIISQNENDYIIRTDRWKLFVFTNLEKTKYALFDMQSDKKETTDVSALYPDIIGNLSRKLTDTLNAGPSYPHTEQPFPNWINEEHRKKLIDTGYFY